MRFSNHSKLALAGLLFAALLPSCPDSSPAPAPPVVTSLGRLLPAIQEDLTQATAKVNQDPKNWELWGNLGVRYEVNSTYAQALECYTVAADHLPDNAQWPYRAAITASRTNDLELALNWIDRSLKVDGSYATSHYRRGNWLLGLGRLEEAKQAYERATELEPKHSESWAGLARVALQNDDTEQALKLIKKARKLSSSDPYLHLIQGITLAQLGRESEAQSHLTVGQGSSPSVVDPWSKVVSQGKSRERDLVKRAKSLEAKGDYEGAIITYREILESRPGEILLPLRLARTLLKAKRGDEAMELVDTALIEHPTSLDLLLFQGAMLSQQGDKEGAWNSCNRALQSSPDRPDAYLLQSSLFAAENNVTGALAAAQTAVDKAPFESRCHEVLARRFSEAKRPWDAVLALESGLEQRGFKPSVNYYKMLLQALKVLKRPDKVPAILERAQADYGTQNFPNES